jgi:hypothetical protein
VEAGRRQRQCQRRRCDGGGGVVIGGVWVVGW